MSPTCSSRFFVGRNARSAAARTNVSLLPAPSGPRQHARSGTKAYAIAATGGNRQPSLNACGYRRILPRARRHPVVCSRRFGASDGGEGRAHARSRACRLLAVARRPRCGGGRPSGRPPGQGRAGGQVPGRGRARPSSRSSRSSPRTRRWRSSCATPATRRSPTSPSPCSAATRRTARTARSTARSRAQQQADKNRPDVRRRPDPRLGRGPTSRQELDPLERSSAYVDTYTLGPLGPNRTATFEWKVTAVHAGDFRICYRVAAGLDGKAKAVPRAAAAADLQASGRATVERRAAAPASPTPA